jgi:hypothetical protein
MQMMNEKILLKVIACRPSCWLLALIAGFRVRCLPFVTSGTGIGPAKTKLNSVELNAQELRTKPVIVF